MSTPAVTDRVIVHVTSEGERWDQLALLYYGDARLYEPIIRANPIEAITPTLPGGVLLNIPVLADQTPAAAATSIASTAGLPPWKQ